MSKFVLISLALFGFVGCSSSSSSGHVSAKVKTTETRRTDPSPPKSETKETQEAPPPATPPPVAQAPTSVSPAPAAPESPVRPKPQGPYAFKRTGSVTNFIRWRIFDPDIVSMQFEDCDFCHGFPTQLGDAGDGIFLIYFQWKGIDVEFPAEVKFHAADDPDSGMVDFRTPGDFVWTNVSHDHPYVPILDLNMWSIFGASTNTRLSGLADKSMVGAESQLSVGSFFLGQAVTIKGRNLAAGKIFAIFGANKVFVFIPGAELPYDDYFPVSTMDADCNETCASHGALAEVTTDELTPVANSSFNVGDSVSLKSDSSEAGYYSTYPIHEIESINGNLVTLKWADQNPYDVSELNQRVKCEDVPYNMDQKVCERDTVLCHFPAVPNQNKPASTKRFTIKYLFEGHGVFFEDSSSVEDMGNWYLDDPSICKYEIKGKPSPPPRPTKITKPKR